MVDKINFSSGQTSFSRLNKRGSFVAFFQEVLVALFDVCTAHLPAQLKRTSPAYLFVVLSSYRVLSVSFRVRTVRTMSGADERHEDEQSKIWLGGLNPSATQEDVEGLMKKYPDYVFPNPRRKGPFPEITIKDKKT